MPEQNPKPPKRRGRVNRIYKRDGFNGVWRWAKGHGIKRWRQAARWARYKAEYVVHKDKRKFQKAAKAYHHKVHHLHKLEEQHHQDTTANGPFPSGDSRNANFSLIDAHWVPDWIAGILQDARASGIWTGSVISGFRTPEYSESLCENMCGAPQCPGMCAGRASNHACPPDGAGTPYEGAVDVSDYNGLEAYCRSHNRPLYGGGYVLPNDLPHFSNSGR